MYSVLNIKFIKKLPGILLCIIILNTYYLIHTTNTAYADNNISLSTSPSFITVEAIPPSNPKTPITIENKGNNPENIQVIFLPFEPSQKQDGQIQYPNNKDIPQSYRKIFEKIHLTDNGIITTSFELGPKQKKDLELQFFLLKEEPTADYYFSVIFLTSPNPINIPPNPCLNTPSENIQPTTSCLSAYSTLKVGIATNVLLSIGSKENPEGSISEFSSPRFIQSGPVPFTVRVKNSGQHFFAPYGMIFIKNIFGQTVGRIDLAPSNVLAGSSRSLIDSSSETGKIIWPEKFLLGPYTATLNLALSEKGPVYNRSIIFFALPLQLAIGIVLVFTIIITIILRIRYKLKARP